MKMSQDVEIIEVDKQVIEISDDDSILEEDIKDVLILDDIGNQSNRDNEINVNAVFSEENLPTDANSTHSCLSAPNRCICLNDESTAQVASSRNADVTLSEVSQVNNMRSNHNFNAEDRHANIENISSINSNPTIFSNNLKNIRKRQRRKNIKKVKNRLRRLNKVLTKPTSEKQRDNTNTNTRSCFEEATCSSNIMTSCRTDECRNYDFSKLKWLTPLKNLSTPPHLQIVIIDRSHQNWVITSDKWLMIEKRLLESLNKEMLRTNDTSIGLFDGAKWQRGIKIIGCHNENAFNFIMNFVMNMDKLWHRAQLDAFPISHISRHIVKVYIPPPILKTEVVMSLIKLQNPSIYSKDWQVIREREKPGKGGIDIWISINDESFTQLCILGGEVKYGVNRIWLNPSR